MSPFENALLVPPNVLQPKGAFLGIQRHVLYRVSLHVEMNFLQTHHQMTIFSKKYLRKDSTFDKFHFGFNDVLTAVGYRDIVDVPDVIV